MKIIINREELLPALQTITGVVERRQTLPILSNILLSVTSDALRLTATDMEVELVTSVKGDFKTEGDLTIPARKLLDICRALPEDARIQLEYTKEKVLLSSGKSRFTLATLPAQEYPLIEMAEPATRFTLSQANMKSLLEKTAFAMAQQDVRYYLNGLMFEYKGKFIRAVATDGHRLALSEIESDTETTAPSQIIIPRKGVMELNKALRDAEAKVEASIGNNHIRIQMDNLQFTSKLIDGKFPDYEKVIPEVGKFPVLVDRELLRQSLTRASILSNEKYRGVRLNLEKDRIRAIAHNPEQEEAEEEVEVNYAGPEIEIGFNVSYLLDALTIIKSKQVVLAISDPNSSCLLLAENDTDSKYVVMPMRL